LAPRGADDDSGAASGVVAAEGCWTSWELSGTYAGAVDSAASVRCRQRFRAVDALTRPPLRGPKARRRAKTQLAACNTLANRLIGWSASHTLASVHAYGCGRSESIRATAQHRKPQRSRRARTPRSLKACAGKAASRDAGRINNAIDAWTRPHKRQRRDEQHKKRCAKPRSKSRSPPSDYQ
jgi:hypothetical protein